MLSVSTAQDSFPASAGGSFHVRTGRMAGANGNLFASGRLGDYRASARFGRSGHCGVSAVEAQEGHQTMRKGDQ